MELSICSYSFHRALAAGKQDMLRYIADCRELGCTQLDPWNGHLAPMLPREGTGPLTAEQESYLEQIEDVRKARVNFVKLAEKMADTPRKDKRRFRRSRWKALRARIEVSRSIRRIEFTEIVKRRLIDEVKRGIYPKAYL